MYCSVCGTRIESEAATYCPNCGASLANASPPEESGMLTDPAPPTETNDSSPQSPTPKKPGIPHKGLLITVCFLFVLALIAASALLLQNSSTNKEVNAFSTVVSAFREYPDQYKLGSYTDEYGSLLEQCSLCIVQKDTSQIAPLTDQIKELKQKIKEESKALDECKAELATFKTAADLYIMEGSDKTTYSGLISKFETALSSNDLSTCKATSKQLLEFTSKLKKTTGQASSKDYEEELEHLKEELAKEKSTSSSQTNIYISPKKEPEHSAEDADDVYVPADTDYILPFSSTSYVTDSDLAGLSARELSLARNEIYARYGRKFKDNSIQSYFNSKSWYCGTINPSDFDEDTYFNRYEKKNVSTIKKYEERHK